LKKHTGDAGLPAYLSTHPDTEQRLAEMKTMAEAAPVRSEPLLADVKWDEVRMLCR
jgi:predicted Zn-dependent protease